MIEIVWYTLYILAAILAFFGIYIISRFVSLAVFRSYFDAKHQSEQKGDQNEEE